MDVTITADVGTFFMRVIGIPTIPATRTAKAEFTLPVPMGSPQNYYGVGILNLPTTHQEQQTTSVSRDTDFRNAGGPITGGQWTPSPSNRSITQVVNDNDGDYATSNNPSQAQAWGNFGMLQTAIGAEQPAEQQPADPDPQRQSDASRSTASRSTSRTPSSPAARGCCSNTRISVQLSKNNGATWLTAVQTPNLGTSSRARDYDLGDNSSTSDWGGGTLDPRRPCRTARSRSGSTWAKGCSQTRTIGVDEITVQVTYRLFTTNTITVTDPPSPQPVRDPYNTVTLAPQNFWGAMQSQGAPSVQGDAYMTGYATRTSATNPTYDPAKYYNYGIDMPSGGGEVWIFDPGFCETGIDGATHQNQGTGENWTVGGSNGNSSAQPVSAQYTLFKDDANTPYEYPDDVWQASSGTTFRRLHLEDANHRRERRQLELRGADVAQQVVAARVEPAGRQVPPAHHLADLHRQVRQGPRRVGQPAEHDGPERLRDLDQVLQRHAAGLRTGRDGGLLPALGRQGLDLLPRPDRGGPRRQVDGHRPVGPG